MLGAGGGCWQCYKQPTKCRAAPLRTKKIIPNVNSAEAEKPGRWTTHEGSVTQPEFPWQSGVDRSTQSLQNLEMVLRRAPSWVLSCK